MIDDLSDVIEFAQASNKASKNQVKLLLDQVKFRLRMNPATPMETGGLIIQPRVEF